MKSTGSSIFYISEHQARNAEICPACNKPKQTGLVVCWHCFKYRENALKYYNGTLNDWLISIQEAI